ncbi:hypothetical protein T4A_9053 [Trichinella pseudospiralis]|uniref:Uncharacterized protein n=1 Tax=Trichinella pseudospiralis TaxID=6337 RepID=A0A0V1EPW0_TRIPS|nr:hypothetical protein T4A_9053 [Trichinella pseudospiralis]
MIHRKAGFLEIVHLVIKRRSFQGLKLHYKFRKILKLSIQRTAAKKGITSMEMIDCSLMLSVKNKHHLQNIKVKNEAYLGFGEALFIYAVLFMDQNIFILRKLSSFIMFGNGTNEKHMAILREPHMLTMMS